MSEISCGSCHIYLGWKIVKAHDESERWKDGKFLLELENLVATTDPASPQLPGGPRERRRISQDTLGSGSDSSTQ